MARRRTTPKKRKATARRRTTGWPTLSMAMTATQIAVESQQVIALRMAKLAAGGARAQREAALMVNEKVKALADSQRMLASAAGKGDGGTDQVLGLYQRRVSANRKRLSRGR